MPSITLTYPAQVGADAAVAFGRRLGLVDENQVRRNATQGEIKQWIIGEVRRVIREEDMDIRREALVLAPDSDIT